MKRVEKFPNRLLPDFDENEIPCAQNARDCLVIWSDIFVILPSLPIWEWNSREEGDIISGGDTTESKRLVSSYLLRLHIYCILFRKIY